MVDGSLWYSHRSLSLPEICFHLHPQIGSDFSKIVNIFEQKCPDATIKLMRLSSEDVKNSKHWPLTTLNDTLNKSMNF